NGRPLGAPGWSDERGRTGRRVLPSGRAITCGANTLSAAPEVLLGSVAAGVPCRWLSLRAYLQVNLHPRDLTPHWASESIARGSSHPASRFAASSRLTLGWKEPISTARAAIAEADLALAKEEHWYRPSPARCCTSLRCSDRPICSAGCLRKASRSSPGRESGTRGCARLIRTRPSRSPCGREGTRPAASWIRSCRVTC